VKLQRSRREYHLTQAAPPSCQDDSLPYHLSLSSGPPSPDGTPRRSYQATVVARRAPSIHGKSAHNSPTYRRVGSPDGPLKLLRWQLARSVLVPPCDRRYAVQYKSQRTAPGADEAHRSECRLAQASSFSHRRNVLPEVLQTIGTTKQGGEVCGVNQKDLARPRFVRRHPKETVEFLVACGGERMWSIRIDRLPGEHIDFAAMLVGQCVMRQMRVEIERGNVVKEIELVEIPKSCQR